MKVTNKQKAIKKSNEYLNLLQTLYNKNNESYLYIYTWVYNAIKYDLLENLERKNDGFYRPRVDWYAIIKDIKTAVLCERIDQRIKNDALSILSNNELMKIFNDLLTCFK